MPTMYFLKRESACFGSSFPLFSCLSVASGGRPHIKKASGKVATVQLADEQMISFFGLYIFE